MQMIDIQAVYEQFNTLSASIKFLIAGVATFFVFMYKTFATMYAENDKNVQSTSTQKLEILFKLQAALSIYSKSTKQIADQNELIYILANTMMYLDFRLRKKIELFYENRSDHTLQLIEKQITYELNNSHMILRKKLPTERFFLFTSNMVRPLFPVLISLIFIAVSFFIVINSMLTGDIYKQLEIVAGYFSVLNALFIFILLINVVIEDFKSVHFRWIPLIGSIIIIVLPLLLMNPLIPVFAILFTQIIIFIGMIFANKIT
ncbi:hypothetical protein PQ456_10665 [Paenibacillus kyungheensis]|uniref:Uncharacterized protein n=1 Tax=Paenibacillus kyungheensis TaxID=1452732 RepID=A0AAX3M809_9BACL|nr:hypothetical protein [Paenibacillus kyungheensis]WCT57948.1 hypothetical protein PQ456_10665 [Paenibacillus kyungheensis]